MMKLTAGLVAAVLAVVFLVTLFGDNIRRLNGMSADALAGDSYVAQPSPLTRKTMKNFGMNNSYGDAPIAPVPQGNSHVHVDANRVTDTREDALSTFAIDVDTASYTLARRTLQSNMLPVADGVRVEEWVNAFRYELPAPKDAPFSVTAEGAPSPFTAGHTLLKVSLKGREVANADRLPANLVFLVDTSCSMQGQDRLELAKESLRILVKNLNARDTVSLVTYAGGVRDVLPPTPATERARIFGAIDELSAGGGTAMGDGMTLAYQHAVHGVGRDRVSRVIVLSDGDANIGRNVTADAMLDAIGRYVKEGVTLTTVGFGMGNYRDNLMEKLADKGNGQSLYIDSREQAVKVFQTQIAGTLEVIAKDVKVQVAFDKSVVKRYRLVGYENRDVADKDFRNDAVDGGEIGAGHSVTALYELELAPDAAGPLATVFVRGQQPRGGGAFETAVKVERSAVARSLSAASTELRFAAAVAGAADILRGNGAASDFTLAKARELAASAHNGAPERLEFVQLLETAMRLQRTGVARASSGYGGNAAY